MKKGFLLKLLVAITILSLMAVVPVSAADQPKHKKQAKSVLVKLKPEKERSKTNGLLTKKFGKIKKLKENLYYIEEGQETLDNIASIKNHPDVEYVEPNASVRKSGDIVPWNMQVIGAQNTQRLGYLGENVKVALLDTGIDLNHSDLKVAGGISFVDGVTSYEDDNGHGTAMAGIIAGQNYSGNILGAAPNVSLYSVKVLNEDGIGRYSDVIEGIKWAVDNHMDIICMSFGSNEYSLFLEDAVDEAYAANILLVAAAGNEGREEINYPAKYENVMAVGAVDEANAVLPYSNQGEELDLVAPGINVLTTGVGGEYTYAKGTSAAAAHVAGAAAVLKSAKSDMTNWQLNTVLCQGSVYLGEKRQYGYGLVNANDSLVNINQFIDNMEEYVPTIKEHVITDSENNVTGTVYASYIYKGDNQTITTGQAVTVKVKLHSPHESIIVTTYKKGTSTILHSRTYYDTYGNDATLTYTCPEGILNQAGTYNIRFHAPDTGTDEYDDVFTIYVVDPPSSDSYEPNDTQTQATTLNNAAPDTRYAKISTATDVDYFKIYVYPGDKIDAQLTMLPANYTLSIIAPNGKIYTSNNSGTRDEIISLPVEVEGLHYIKVYGSSTAYSTSEYRLSVNRTIDKDDYEQHSTTGINMSNNDSLSSAYNFYVDTTKTIEARISNPSDKDWFMFTAPKGPVTIDLSNLPLDYELHLYANSSTKLMSSTNGGTAAEKIVYNVTENYKTLYVMVEGYNNSKYSLKNYTLKISYEPLIASVSNITKNSATVTWTTLFPGTTEIDYGTTTSLGQSSSDSSLVTNHSINAIILSSATKYYYKATSAIQNNYSTVSSATDSFITRDKYEPNDEYSSPSNGLAAMGTIEATIDSPYDEDWFGLTLAGPGRITLDLTNIPAGCDYDIIMVKDNRYYSFLSKSGNADERISIDLDSGTYYFGVVSIGLNYDALNKYTLKYSFAEYAYIVDELHFGGEGTYTATGNYSKTFSDMKTASGIGEFEVSRTYNSKDDVGEYFGRGWMFNVAGKTGDLKRTFVYSDGTRETITDPNYRMVKISGGVMYIFKKNPNGTFTAEDSRNTLVKNADGTYTFTTKDQKVYNFNSNGYLTSIRDKVGNTMSITVDGTGKVTSFTDFTGRSYTVTYLGNLISKIKDNTDGREINYTYTSGRLTKVVDAAGKTTSYTYDSDGYLSEIRDGSNVLIEAVEYNTYLNEPKKVKMTTDALGNIFNYAYDVAANKTTITDSQGRTTVQSYDSKKFITEDIDSLGRKTIIQYTTDSTGKNKYGEPWYVIDVNGNKTTYEWDSKGNVTKIINPDTSFKQYAYDDKNNVIWERNEVGNFTVYQYDAAMVKLMKKGKYLKALLTQPTQTVTLTDTNAGDFAVETYSYYPDGQFALKGLVNTYTDPVGNITVYTYDAKGNLLTIKDPETGKLTNYENNASNLRTAEISPRGFRTEYIYDKDNRLIKSINKADDGVTRVIYDSEGRKVREISPNQYNAAADGADGYTDNTTGTRYEYYANGLLKKVTNAENEVTEYAEYDKYGNVKKEIKPKQYDENGVLRADAGIYLYDYDNANRLTKVWFKANEPAAAVLLEEYTYTVQADGSTFKPVNTKKAYLNDTELAVTVIYQDYAERLLKQQNPDGTYATVTYLADGRLSSTTDGNNNTAWYTYDTFNAGTNTTASETWLPVDNGYTYERVSYDKAGRQAKVEKGLTVVPQGTVPGALITIQYEYYKNGKLKSESDSDGRRTDYFYDDDGWVSRVEKYASSTKKIVTEYQNNYAGKPLQQQVYLDGETLYNDNRTGLITTYTYDKNNNLKTVTSPDNKITTYGYDNLNRQISVSKTITGEGGTPVTSVVETLYNADGNVRYLKDANGNETKYGYNTQGLLEKVIDGEGGVAAYGYDRAGRKTIEISPANYVAGAALTAMNRTEYTYDLMNRIKTKTEKYVDPVQGAWVSITVKTFNYDGNGNVLKEIDALGYETNYTYTKDNKIKTVLDAVSKDRGLQFTTKYTYDALGRKETEINGKNVTKKYYYDRAGNLTKHTVILNGGETIIEENTFDFLNNKLTSKNGNGKTTIYEYNSLNKVKKSVSPGDASIPANTVEYRYDVLENLAWTQDSFGTVNIFTYDEQGNLLTKNERKTDGTEGITLATRYDKNGNKRFMTDGNGNTTEYTYNRLNKVLASTTGGKTTTYTYDKNSNLKTETDWRGNTVSYEYDPLNRLIQKKDANNVVIEKLEYNANGAQVKAYNALNQLTQYEYDKNNRLTKTINPLNHFQSQTYDNVGNIDSKTDGNGKTTTFVYDDLNRLKEVRATVGGVVEKTSYTYDLMGNMLTQTDGKGQTVTMEYNATNKLSRRIDNGGLNDVSKQESYTYYPNGLMKTKTDRNGKTTIYTYDTHGRLLSQIIDSTGISFTYDNNGNQLTMNDNSGTTVRTYDAFNRVLTKTTPHVGDSIFAYDVIDGLSEGQWAETSIDPKGNTVKKVYDKTGRLVQVFDSTETSPTLYAYYDNGALKSVTYPNGGKEEYTYHANGTLYQLTNKKPDGSVMDTYTYTYDANGNQLSKTENINGVNKGTTTYTYDELNRLKTVTEPGGKLTTYTYDKAGNRETETVTQTGISVATTYQYNGQNRLTRTVTEKGDISETNNYYYDPNGNLVSKTKETLGIAGNAGHSLSQAGAGADSSVVLYEYNPFNQLTRINTGAKIMEYGYNGEGLKVSETVYGQTSYYTYEYDKIVLETDGSGSVKARNLYGTNLISRKVDSNNLYYMYNGHGDVTALIGTDGTIVASYYYDAFGVPIEQTGNADNPFRYAGYEYDEETGLYYLKARFYDAAIARFIQEDTYRGNPNDPLSLNLYTYVHNNPLVYIDPTGHDRDMIAYENSVYNLTDVAKMYHGSVKWDEATKSATVVIYKNGEYHNYTFRLADGWQVKNKKIQITLGTFQDIISKPGKVYVPKAKGSGTTFNNDPVRLVVKRWNQSNPGERIFGHNSIFGGGGDTAFFLELKRMQSKGIDVTKLTLNELDEMYIRSKDATLASMSIGLAIGGTKGVAPSTNKEPPKSQWYKPDGSINYPPNNGAVAGTEVTTTLQKGQSLGRYGNITPKSDYVTAPGASPSSLSLPPNTSSSFYTEYVVVKPIPNTVQSTVAPWGGDVGGGLQYKLPMPIEQLLKEGYIIKK